MSRIIKMQKDRAAASRGNTDSGEGSDFKSFDGMWRRTDDNSSTAILDPQKFIKTEIEKARHEAQNLINEARKEAEGIKERAYQKSYAKGEEEGRKSGHAEYQSRIQAVERVLADFQGKSTSLGNNIQDDMFELVKAMVDRLVQHEVKTNPEVIRAALSKSMEFVVENSRVRISLHPDDFNTIKEAASEIPALLEGKNRIQLIEDPSIVMGGCLVSTDFGEVDATIDTMRENLFTAVEQAFRNALSMSGS